jgi:hypothetical protein
LEEEVHRAFHILFLDFSLGKQELGPACHKISLEEANAELYLVLT